MEEFLSFVLAFVRKQFLQVINHPRTNGSIADGEAPTLPYLLEQIIARTERSNLDVLAMNARIVGMELHVGGCHWYGGTDSVLISIYEVPHPLITEPVPDVAVIEFVCVAFVELAVQSVPLHHANGIHQRCCVSHIPYSAGTDV